MQFDAVPTARVELDDEGGRRQKQTGEDGGKQMATFFHRSTSRVELSVKSISLAARGG